MPLSNWIDFCEYPNPKFMLKKGRLFIDDATDAAENLIEQYKEIDDNNSGNYEIIEKYNTLSYRHDFITSCFKYLIFDGDNSEIKEIIKQFGYDPEDLVKTENKLKRIEINALKYKSAIEAESGELKNIRHTLYEVVSIIEKWIGAQIDLDKTTLERFMEYRKLFIKTKPKEDGK